MSFFIALLASFVLGISKSGLKGLGIVFVTMMGIIMYHFYLQYIVKSTLWLRFITKVTMFKERIPVLSTKATAAEPLVDVVTGKSSHDPHRIVTHSEIELREPLL